MHIYKLHLHVVYKTLIRVDMNNGQLFKFLSYNFASATLKKSIFNVYLQATFTSCIQILNSYRYE